MFLAAKGAVLVVCYALTSPTSPGESPLVPPDLDSLNLTQDGSAPGSFPGSSTEVNSLLVRSGATLFGLSYMMMVSVSLASDPGCEGPMCKERYLSLIPVAGGVLQVATAGKAFHDEHHSRGCVPLIIAAVAAQTLGVAGIVTGLALSDESETDNDLADRLLITPATFGGRGLGVTVGLR